VIVHRYGETRVGESVDKAIRENLDKLARPEAHRRLLMLERDQPWVSIEEICAAIEALRPRYPELACVTDIWIADTATVNGAKDYVEFQRYDSLAIVESCTFFNGVLRVRSKEGIPFAVARP
jgi:hypothetical protein